MDVRRNEVIDISKGIGIILMIMGHVGLGSFFDHWIHAFHMPMFFIISGFLYKDRIFTKKFFIKRIRQLLVPYIIVGCFHYFIWFILHVQEDIDLVEPLVNLFWTNTNYNMPIAGAIWFLTAFFVSNILFSIFMTYLNRYAGKVCLGIAFFTCILNSCIKIRLPWAIDSGLVGCGLMYIGYIWKKISDTKKINILRENIAYSILAFFLFSFGAFINGYVNMREGKYSVIWLFWINAVGLTISINLVCEYIIKYRKEKLYTKVLRYIGKNSISFLCFNQLVIFFLKKIEMLFWKTNANLIIMLGEKVIITSVAIILLFGINELIFKTKLRVIFGR